MRKKNVIIWTAQELDKSNSVSISKILHNYPETDAKECIGFFIQHCSERLSKASDHDGDVLYPLQQYTGTFLPIAKREATRQCRERFFKHLQEYKLLIELLSLPASLIALVLSICNALR